MKKLPKFKVIGAAVPVVQAEAVRRLADEEGLFASDVIRRAVERELLAR